MVKKSYFAWTKGIMVQFTFEDHVEQMKVYSICAVAISWNHVNLVLKLSPRQSVDNSLLRILSDPNLCKGPKVTLEGLMLGMTGAPILWPPDVRTDYWKRPWCWARLKAGEGDDRSGWMASLTQWTWVWASSRSWWWTGKPGVFQSMGSQRVGCSWATDLNWKVTHA